MPPKVQARSPPARRSARHPLSEPPIAPSPKESLSGENAAVETIVEGRSSQEIIEAQDVPEAEDRSEVDRTPIVAHVTTPAQRSVQRLDSLTKRNAVASSSKSASSGSRPTGLKFQPKSFIRRSKEERQAVEEAEEEKRQARIAADAANVRSTGALRNGRGGGPSRGGFQGGMSGWRLGRKVASQATGPLSGGPSNEPAIVRTKARDNSKIGSSIRLEDLEALPGFTSPTKVKKEPAVKPEKVKNARAEATARASGKTREKKIKREESGPMILSSSEEDNDLTGPRINIEYINLISDESSEEEPSTTKGKERQISLRPSGWNLKPIRLDRHEHVERHVGLNMDTSFMTSAQLRQRAKERAAADGDLFLSDHEDDELAEHKSKKPNSKGKDVEFVRDERRWRGVYQDENDMGNHAGVKDEAHDENAMVVEVAEATVKDQEPPPTNDSGPSIPAKSNNSIERPGRDTAVPSRTMKRRKKSLFQTKKPILQTEEDRQEWERYEDDVTALREELGFLDTALDPVTVPEDTDGDIEMEEEVDGEEKQDRRKGLVYLFQFPPIIPKLVPPDEVLGGIEDPASLPQENSSQARRSVVQNPEQAVKIEDDNHTNTTKIPNAILAEDLADFCGSVGKLTIYESGHIGISWGGIEHELSKGAEGELLQELVISDVSHVKKEDGREGDEEMVARTGTAMGQMTGGFVVTPNWVSLFEN